MRRQAGANGLAAMFGGRPSTGGRTASNRATVQTMTQRAAAVAPPSARSVAGRRRIVTLRNYLNIVDVIDGLRYQLPAIATEVHSGLIAAMVQRCFGQQRVGPVVGVSPTNYLDSTRLIGDSFELGGSDGQLYVRLSWSMLLRDHLLPLFELIGVESERGKRFDPRLRVNSALRDLDKELTNMIAINLYGGDGRYDDDNDVEHDGDEWTCDATTDMSNPSPQSSSPSLSSSSLSSSSMSLPSSPMPRAGGVSGNNNVTTAASVARLRKLLTNLRALHLASGNNVNANSSSLLLPRFSNCSCCFYSPALFLYCSLTDETLVNATDFSLTGAVFSQLFRNRVPPSVLFDVASILCQPMPNDHRFDEDFKIDSVPPAGTPATNMSTFVNLYKGCRVAEMGFAKNMFTMHLLVNSLVNWLWTRHRTLHTHLNGRCVEGETMFDSPPVTVYVSRELYPLFDRYDTVPWLALRKARKVIVHVI